jgi:hypothetical protein
MTYQQALQILYRTYSDPLAVSGTDRLKAMTSAGVPLSMASDINRLSYTAARKGTTVDTQLQTAGLLTSTGTTTTTPVTVPTAPVSTTTTTQAIPTITVPNLSSTTGLTTTTTPIVDEQTKYREMTGLAPLPSTSTTVPTISVVDEQTKYRQSVGLPPLTSTTTTGLPAGIPTQIISDGILLTYKPPTVFGQQPSLSGVNSRGETVNLYISDLQEILSSGRGTIQDGRLVLGSTTTTSTPSTAAATIPNVSVTVPGSPATTSPIQVPTLQNPIQATTPEIPTIVVPPVFQDPAKATFTPTMGGSLEDQMNYQSAIRKLTAAQQRAEIQARQQRGEIGTQYESQIRRAGREMYNQQIKALASLGARGISGAPGLSVAARRAAMAEPAAQRTSLINERSRQLGALERALANQLGDYEEELRRNQEQLTRATTLANQLTGTGQ